MSKLAGKIASTPIEASRVRRGPANSCFPVYGHGDQEDADAVAALRDSLTWREIQAHVDSLLGVERPIAFEKFRYHWRQRCYCWPEDMRA